MRKKCWIFDKVHLFRASIFFRSFIDYLRLKIETWSNCVKRNKYLLNKKTVAIVVVDSCRCVILTRITWKTSEKTNTSIALFMEDSVILVHTKLSFAWQMSIVSNSNGTRFRIDLVASWWSAHCSSESIVGGRQISCASVFALLYKYTISQWTRTEWTVESLQNYFYRRWRRKKTPREIQLCKKLSARNKRKRSIKTLCTVVVHKCLVCELSTYTQHLKWKTIRIREKRIILLTKFWLVEHPNR